MTLFEDLAIVIGACLIIGSTTLVIANPAPLASGAPTAHGALEVNGTVHVESLDHIHVYAADPEASARFYERHFEAKPVHRNANVHGDARIFLALGGQILVVGSFPTGMRPAAPPEAGDGAYRHGFGVAHFGLRVTDVAAAVAELSAAGVPVLSEVVREPSGAATYAAEA